MLSFCRCVRCHEERRIDGLLQLGRILNRRLARELLRLIGLGRRRILQRFLERVGIDLVVGIVGAKLKEYMLDLPRPFLFHQSEIDLVVRPLSRGAHRE